MDLGLVFWEAAKSSLTSVIHTLYLSVPRMSIRAFSSPDVVALVGITPIQLNALVTRKLYKIKPSISGTRRKVRIFDEQDVFGIALVWALFQSGLRTEQIRTILKDLAETREADARYTAQGLLESVRGDYIVVIGEPRKRRGKRGSEEQVGIVHQYELVDLIAENSTSSVLAIPIRAKFTEVEKRIELLFPE